MPRSDRDKLFPADEDDNRGRWNWVKSKILPGQMDWAPIIYNRVQMSGSSTQTLTSTSYIDLSPAVEVTIIPHCRAKISVTTTWDVQCSVLTNGTFSGKVLCTPTEVSSVLGQSTFTPVALGQRQTVVGSSTFVLGAETSYTIKLQVAVAAGAGTFLIYPQHTGMIITQVQDENAFNL